MIWYLSILIRHNIKKNYIILQHIYIYNILGMSGEKTKINTKWKHTKKTSVAY